MRRGLTVDVGGTLLSPTEPVGLTYARLGAPFGVDRSPAQIGAAFRGAFRVSGEQIGDGRPFWRAVVTESTGCDDPALFEQLYAYYLRPEAWTLREGAREALITLRDQGLVLAILSNWDTRLPTLLQALGLAPLFETIVCSGEQGVEKPDPRIFTAAARALGLPPSSIVHLGDDPIADEQGAIDAGFGALLWGRDLKRYAELPGLMGRG